MIGLITINDNNNYGNRLQNYACYYLLSKYDKTFNIVRRYGCEFRDFGVNHRFFIVRKLKRLYRFLCEMVCFNKYTKNRIKLFNFKKFNKLIKNGETLKYNFDYNKINKKYDYFFVGSDQVWNPTFSGNGMFINMLGFCDDSNKKNSISASISIETLSAHQKSEFTKYLSSFNKISCRELQGSALIKNLINKEVYTLIDPTLMLDSTEWDKVSCEPKNFYSLKKYLFVFVLGETTEQYATIIDYIRNRYNLEVVNVLDINSRFYTCGPSEFIYLIKKSSFVLTDSYHCTIFSYIYNKPFRVLQRVGKGLNMNSRLSSLFELLKIHNNHFVNIENYKKISLELNYDKKDLINEQNKFYDFLDSVLGAPKDGN